MSDDLSIDLGSLLEYGVNRVLELIGRDPATNALRQWLSTYMQMALQTAGTVQCVGMSEPIPLTTIYRPTRVAPIRTSAGPTRVAADLLRDSDNAIVFARPGCGKTTLLNWLYCAAMSDSDRAPFLFVLRWPESVDRLVEFVTHFKTSKAFRPFQGRDVLLLVDGYDEISREERHRVSAALREFTAHKIGRFLLTCRSFYDVYDLGATHYQVLPFGPADVRAYLDSFSRVYSGRFDPDAVIAEIERGRLEEFVSHPLMLALVAILKSGPGGALPKHALALVQRGVDTLTFRWDQSKGLSRPTELGVDIDGFERVRCMMRVAYRTEIGIAKDEVVRRAIVDQLRLFQRTEAEAGPLLNEMAQWYGILIPAEPEGWTFSHRIMHDYLAARFWVESGTFHPASISHWSARAAYAACLVPDATEALKVAFTKADSWSVLGECVTNGASFDVNAVAPLVVRHFASHWALAGVTLTDGILKGGIEDKDCFDVASTEFLLAILAEFSAFAEVVDRLQLSQELVLCVILSELSARAISIEADTAQRIRRRYDGVIKAVEIRRHRSAVIMTLDELFRPRSNSPGESHPSLALTESAATAGLTALRSIVPRSADVLRLAWSPDGSLFATAGSDRLIRVWSSDGAFVRALSDAPNVVCGLAWSDDGSYIAASHERIRVWDTRTGELTILKGRGAPTYGLLWMKGQAELVSAGDDGTLVVWDIAARQPVMTAKSASGQLWSIAWDNQRKVALVGSSTGQLSEWRPGSNTLTSVYRADSAIWGIWMHPSEAYGVLAHDDGRLTKFDRDFLRVSQTGGGTAITHLSANSALSRLAAISRDGVLRLWSLPEMALVATVGEFSHWRRSQAVCYSPTHPILATLGYMEGMVMLWREPEIEPLSD